LLSIFGDWTDMVPDLIKATPEEVRNTADNSKAVAKIRGEKEKSAGPSPPN
jgi:hypothetical protein